jgi:hypothetical protein
MIRADLRWAIGVYEVLSLGVQNLRRLLKTRDPLSSVAYFSLNFLHIPLTTFVNPVSTAEVSRRK